MGISTEIGGYDHVQFDLPLLQIFLLVESDAIASRGHQRSVESIELLLTSATKIDCANPEGRILFYQASRAARVLSPPDPKKSLWLRSRNADVG